MAIKPVTVSQLNQYIGRILRTDPILGNVRVRGEISNLKYHGSGHIYFTLKDAGSRVRGFLAADAAAGLRYELSDGMEVIVSGYLSVYRKGGYYSLNIRDLEVAGAGELDLAFRALYDRLQKEGLFDPARKRPLPAYPECVCILTSPTGAAIQDMLKILRKRNPGVRVRIVPCLVQGDAAAADIASALREVNGRFEDVDTILLGRGGGSREDLWAFNEEIVARSIAASRIPVISAVGHETDVSISDFVADARAETPTAAAMMAVPDLEMLRRKTEELYRQIRSACASRLELRTAALRPYTPEMFRNRLQERIRSNGEQLRFLLVRCGEGIRHRWKESAGQLALQNVAADRAFERRMTAAEACVAAERDRIRSAYPALLTKLEQNVEHARVVLEAGDPERTVARGYAILEEPDTGRVLAGVGTLQPGGRIRIRMKDGTALADIFEVHPE